MTNEEKLISALETTIETQKQLIKHLTAEIDRLNLNRLVINPTQPVNPYQNPLYPFYQPNPLVVPFTTPINPLEPPYIVKCTDGTSPLPPGIVTINGGVLKEEG